jgi:MarR family transcriptional regulator for hemolysin
MRKGFDQSVAQLGVTRSHWVLIAILARSPGITQREIAEALEMTEVSAGRLVDRLCQQGLLERRARAGDRRAYSVHLTEKANPLMAKIQEFAEANEMRAFAGVGDAELRQFLGVVDRIYVNIGATQTEQH